MARALLQQEDVDKLLQSGKLSVSGQYQWKRGSHKSWLKIQVPVNIEDPKVTDVNLRIVVSVSLTVLGKRDFSLIWNSTIRVRGLCVSGNHTNRHTNAERWLRQMHKHKWTDQCLDRFAYTPTDITAEDVQGQFAQFCAECGITCSASLAELPSTQGGLYNDL
jgi:hypothetical protein